jgi:hypothetical protein
VPHQATVIICYLPRSISLIRLSPVQSFNCLAHTSLPAFLQLSLLPVSPNTTFLMRLLQLCGEDDFSLVECLGSNVPRYAILSHTWGPDSEEVTLKDLIEGTARSKKGYRKLAFCGKQAAQDGLQYFWADTCCIDKTSSAELSEAINSMYHWYQEAEVCYAYLADAPSRSEFRDSRWFTRGWTLQELIAPSVVVFLDENWRQLGTKANLRQVVSDRTSIPVNILSGDDDLESFSVAQKMAWAARRETSRIEDRAYCLMGIFGINMPLLYGERESAFIRLQEGIMKISDDHSLFAWKSPDNRGGLLATSPSSFIDSYNIVQFRTSFHRQRPPRSRSRYPPLQRNLCGRQVDRYLHQRSTPDNGTICESSK